MFFVPSISIGAVFSIDIIIVKSIAYAPPNEPLVDCHNPNVGDGKHEFRRMS